ncbi:hypothetical protein DVH05_009406 [Phytophthora capsici]|nr:hypothetical protein DVH05_009406 [Phytophthora capsici]
MTDRTLSSTVLLRDQESSLSKQLINDNVDVQAINEPERSISEDEELETTSGVLSDDEPERRPVMKRMQELVTWESLLVALVVLLVLAHLWNLLELSAANLEAGD